MTRLHCAIELRTLDVRQPTEFEIERHIDTLIVKVRDHLDSAEATIDLIQAARLRGYLDAMLAMPRKGT